MEVIDIITTNKPFLFKGEHNFKTKIGGILTIIYILIGFILSFFYLKNLIEHENYQKINKIEANAFDWGPVSIKVLAKTPKSDEKLGFIYYQVNQFNRYNMTEPCTKDQLEEMNEAGNDKNFNYYCTTINSFYRWSFKQRCLLDIAEQLGLSCHSTDRAINYKFLAYEFYSERDMSIRKKIYELNNFHKNVSIFNFNHNKLIIDKDYFFKSSEIVYFSDISYVDFFTDFWSETGNNAMTSLVELYSRKTFIIEKNYEKFGDGLAKVSSLLNLFVFFILFFYYFYLNYLYEKEILEYLLRYTDTKAFLPLKNESDLGIISSNSF